MFHLRRKLAASLTLSVVLVPVSAIAAPKEPVLVTVVTNQGVSVTGEIGQENDADIEVFDLTDLTDGKRHLLKKADLRSVTKDVSEKVAIGKVGLPPYMAWKIKQVLPASTVGGKIAKVDGVAIYVTLGATQGIEASQELTVYRGAEEIIDPDTKKVIGGQRQRIAKLQVTEVQEKFCKGKLLGDLEVKLEVGDVVETTGRNYSVVILPLVNSEGEETAGTKRIAEELTTGLVKRGVRVVERRLLDKVLTELKAQQTGDFDRAKAQAVGKQIGAYAVLAGTFAPKQKNVEAHLRLLKVETGEILAAASHIITDTSDILGSVRILTLQSGIDAFA